MDNNRCTQKRPLIWIAILLAGICFIAAIVVRLWRRRLAAALAEQRTAPEATQQDIQGLTEVEAKARQLEGRDNAIDFTPPGSLQDMWRETVFTIFNFSLVGMVIVQLLLGQPLGALTSFGVIVLNIGLKIRRKLRVQKKLEDLKQVTRPKATVIREGKIRSIYPREIVIGDMLIAGPGDQIFVDGEIVGESWGVVDEAMLFGKNARITKRSNDQIYAGSFCVSGHVIYEAQKVGKERLIATRISGLPARKAAPTQLEHTIEQVLKALLVVVIVFIIFMARIYFRLNAQITVNEQAFVDAASIIFSIAPSSLYFMIVLTYAAGTTGLAKVGALVRKASSVESLAQVSVVCFAQAGILTGTRVEVEIIEPPAGSEQLTESRIRQILGDYAHNTSVNNLATQAMIATFDGARRTVREEAPFLSMYGWTGIAFDDADLKGIYILGEPQALKTCLAADDEAGEEQAEIEQESASWHKAIAPLGYFFRRSEPDPKEVNIKQAPGPEPETKTEVGKSRLPEAAPKTEAALLTQSFFQRLSEPINSLLRPSDTLPPDELENPVGKSRPNIFRRLTGRVDLILRPKEALEDESPNQAAGEETALIFAYYPELTPLYSTEGLPQLPDGLIPLCKLRYIEQARPEALDTIRTFFEADVGIKVFTTHSPERTITILEQTELGKGEGIPLRVVTGPELAEMDAGKFAQVVAESTVFGQITPEQAGLVVESLREQGESVAVVGDKVTDLPAMQHANLTIARRSSSQITLSMADIILLNDSPQVLQTVIDKGQRIANGLLDMLKLNLTQVFYLALLIVGIRMAAAGFPFQPKQGMVINILTLTIPSMALSLWAKAGVLPSASLNWLLARFVAPAAITMGAVATIVYRIFLERTGEVAYAQLTLTYTLVIAGLLLVLFVKSPEHLGRAGAILSGDKRFLLLVLGLLVLFAILVSVPLTQDFFELALLRQPTDYLIVGAASFAWAITMRLIWLIKPLQWKK